MRLKLIILFATFVVVALITIITIVIVVKQKTNTEINTEVTTEINTEVTTETNSNAVCSVGVSENLGSPSPLLVEPGTKTSFRASDTKGTLSFALGQHVLLACPGAGNYLTVTGGQEAIATCVDATSFNVNGVKYEMNQLKCFKWPVHVQRARGSCSTGKTEIEIGFDISTGFMELITVCHDTTLHHTIYTKFILTSDAAGSQTGVERPDWAQGTFFSGLDPTTLYKRETQRTTMTVLLGSAELAEKHIHLTNDYFLSKGHLVAKADFLYGAHQLSTFWYSNASPQWQTFNGNNWNALENDCRSFAGRIDVDLEVYTGTYGRGTLRDVNNNYVDLYLTTTGKMPAPRMFWKVLYNRRTQAGIAFVGLNNPYQDPSTIPDDVHCTDICSQVTWLTWSQKDVVRGYSYCCEVNDFRKTFTELPAFTVTSILK